MAIVAVRMGYGHLRPAHALATELGEPLLEADQPPLAQPEETRLWHRSSRWYEAATRVSQIPFVGAPLRAAVNAVTTIPHLYPYRDQSAPTWAVRTLERLQDRGLGRGLVEYLKDTGEPLLTTYFASALCADRAGLENIYCVVTDADVHRVWAPENPARSNIEYLVPSRRAMQRLRAYGVPAERIHFTGFPLPGELLGGPELPALKRNLASRLVRLDPAGEFRMQFRDELEQFLGDLGSRNDEPPLITFAIGGAGAQTGLVTRFLKALRRTRVRIALVAGVREEVADALRAAIKRARLDDVEVLYEQSYEDYFPAFNALLARTDILWTKPSEVTFFGALGLALVLAPPVGQHERYNRRWARQQGAALKQRDPRYAHEWLTEWIEDGTLAHAAWCGFTRLPKFGLYRTLEMVK